MAKTDAKQTPAAIPEWATTTPPDHQYLLEMFESSDQSVEEVDLTRDEYIALKAHLAALRGYGVSANVAEALWAFDQCQKLHEMYGGSNDAQQVIMHLQTARHFYQHLPALVVFRSELFDKMLEMSLKPTK